VNNIKRTNAETNTRKLVWMTPELRSLVRQRRKAERHMKRTPTQDNIIVYKKIKAQTRYQLKQARKKAWEEYVSTITNKTSTSEIWNKIAKISGKTKSTTIRRLRLSDGTVLEKPREIAEEMAYRFAETSSNTQYQQSFVTTKEETERIPPRINDLYEAQYNQPFTEQELDEALENCTGSSPGPDHVEYELIRQMGTTTKKQLLKAYNNIWMEGIFPDQWKIATVIPIA
jgi:hypothetical protein